MRILASLILTRCSSLAVLRLSDKLDPSTDGKREPGGWVALAPYTFAGDRSGVLYSDDGGRCEPLPADPCDFRDVSLTLPLRGSSWHRGGQVLDRVGSSECIAAELEDHSLLLSFRVEDKDTVSSESSRMSAQVFNLLDAPAGMPQDDPQPYTRR